MYWLKNVLQKNLNTRIFVLLVVLTSLGPVAAKAAVTAVPANDFLNSMGVNTHIAQGFAWYNYTNALVYTGIRNIRDAGSQAKVSNYVSLHQKTGVHINICAGPNEQMDSLTNCAIGLATNGVLLSIEGPNEPNNWPITYKGVTGGGGSMTTDLGLSVNTSTGVISGTNTTAGTYAIALKAANGSGAMWGVLVLEINGSSTTPVITNAAAVTASTNSAFSYQICATNNPTSYDAAYLPPGLSVNKTTGAITGTPTTAGGWDSALLAINANGTNTAFVRILVDGNPAIPVITSRATARATTGSAFSYQITATPSPTSYNANLSWVPVATFQRDLYSTVVNSAILSNYPVFHVSTGGAEVDNVGMQFLTIPAGAGCVMPDGTQYADYANPHNYVSGSVNQWWDNMAWFAEEPAFKYIGQGIDCLYSEYGLTWNKSYTGYTSNQLVTLPRVTTETGWAIGVAGITEYQQGNIYLNLYLDAYKRGWTYTFIYQMYDNQGGSYLGGIYKQNWGAGKPVATNLHNLTTILADTNTFTPGSLNYSIPSQPSTVHDLLMQKGNGTFYLAVWDERTSGTDNVTVNLGATAPSVKIYDPTVGTNVVQTLSNTNSVSLTLSNHPLILAISGPLDSVGDGIPDSWRAQYFGGDGLTTNAQSCATCDADGTGQNNLFKYLAGLNPTNNAAYLHVIAITSTGSDMNVTYLGASGDNTWSPGFTSRTNVLECATGATDGSYSNNFVSTGQTNVLSGGAGLGTVASFVDTNGASGATKYYRVRVLVP